MSEEIEYKLKYSIRKSVLINIGNTGEVVITAPVGCKKDEIDKIIKKKSKWINSKLRLIRERKALPKDTILYLGVEKKVRIIVQKYIKKNFVVMYNDEFIVNVKNENEVLDTLKIWLKRKFTEIVNDKVQKYMKFFYIKPSLIQVKEQKRRWGSCTYDNKIFFNWRLVMATEEVIEYVVVHEMCHMIHKNHSKDFWNEVEKIFPSYKESEKWLKEKEYLLQLLHLQP